jgi:hypothetical protein
MDLKGGQKGTAIIYELLLRRLGSKDKPWEYNIRRKVLSWVTLSFRPITVLEMQYACVAFEGRKSFNPDTVILPTVEEMLRACGGLVEVVNEDQLRFTHHAVREFLLQPLDNLSEDSRRDERVTSCMVDEAEGHAWMAMTCGKPTHSMILLSVE